MIYFAQNGSDNTRIKIGFSDDVSARIAQIARAEEMPLRLLTFCEGNYQLETKLQNRFAHLHLGNEWFVVDEELRHVLQNIAFGVPVVAAVDDIDASTGSIRGKYGMAKAIYSGPLPVPRTVAFRTPTHPRTAGAGRR